MKSIFLTSLLAVSLMSCSACAGNSSSNGGNTVDLPATIVPSAEPTEVPVPKPPEKFTFSQENWEFTLPEPWPLEGEQGECTPQNCGVVLRSPNREAMVIFIRETFNESFDTFVILSLRSLKGIDAEVISADPVMINGHNFVLIKALKNEVIVDNWVTVKNNNAYNLSCGGFGDNAELCSQIAASLIIR
jgi:hypothetical protein